MILVPQKAIDKLMGWNEPDKRFDIQYDRKTCYTWLLSLVGKDQLAAFNIDHETMHFIEGMYKFPFNEHISISDSFF